MRAWDTDAGRFNPAQGTEFHIYKNTKIENYLQVGDRDHKFILVGRKGLGKTLLLRSKSYLYREKYAGNFRFNSDDHELTENLDIAYGTFSKDELMKFSDFNLWERIWKFILLVIIFKIYGIKFTRDIDHFIGDTARVSALLYKILNNRSQIESYLKNLDWLYSNIHQVQSGVAVFIDDLDQALETILKDPHARDDQKSLSTAVQLWNNAQGALVASIYGINRQNSHIKVFATIRSEAFGVIPYANRQNYQQYLTELEYTKEEARKIFENNIQLMKKEGSRLANPSAKSLIEQFLGFDTMPHPFAKDEQGKKRFEEPFDFIYRHSYGRPREVVRIGKEVFQDYFSTWLSENQSKEEKIENFRERVNAQSGQLLNDYLNEIVPSFDKDKLDGFLSTILQNVITREKLDTLDARFTRSLYSLGLLGYARALNLEQTKFRQVFLVPGRETYRRELEVPKASYYMTHPSLDKKLIQKHEYQHFYNDHNIIGHGYPFYPPSKGVGLEQGIKYWLPRQVNGDRLHKGARHFRHKLGLKAYYQAFFSSEERYLVDLRNELPKLATDLFFLLAEIRCAQRLEDHAGYSLEEAEWRRLAERLEYSMIRNSYQTYLGDIGTQTLIDFHYRLIGRLLVLGLWQLLDLNINEIHYVLTQGHWPRKEKDTVARKGDTPIRYLRISFFIHGLYSDVQNASATYRQRRKELIYSNLSEFERKMLCNWRRALPTRSRDWVWLDKDSSIWLRKNYFSRIWKCPYQKAVSAR